MRFEFCGNVDCPEWALAEISLLNRISAVKLKLILVQIVKKITGQPFDNEKISKLCRDQKFDAEETKVCVAIIEFLLRQATKHQTSDKVFSKDLLQMGVAIENANALVKTIAEQQEVLARALKHDSLRISQITGLQYGLSYIIATSSSGAGVAEQGGVEPLDVSVNVCIDVLENPKTHPKLEVTENSDQV